MYKIVGSTATSNFINMPKLAGQSLNLTGRYIYFFFKPVPNKCFSMHIDVNTAEKTTIRVSFSNLFKEFKATSTWLQFPYVIQAPKGTVYEKAEQNARDLSGAAPPITKWTILCVDLINLTQVYASRTFQCVRGYKLCANLLIKNVVTSDFLYEPGVSHVEARLRGGSAVPRELAYPCEKYDNWHQLYDYISFPSESFRKPFDSAGQSRILTSLTEWSQIAVKQVHAAASTALDNLTKPKQQVAQKRGVFRLPLVGVEEADQFVTPDEFVKQNEADIHVYPLKSSHESASPRDLSEGAESNADNLEEAKFKSSLEPDPILRLKKLIGFGSGRGEESVSFNNLLWTRDSEYLIYTCQAIIIALNVTTSEQWCFVGHADKVSCLAMNPDNSLIASGQTGQFSLIRLWDFQSRKCLAIFRHHDHSLHLLEFSQCGNYICGVGKDKQGKTMLAVWDVKEVKSCPSGLTSSNSVRLVAKAHTDVHIAKVLFVHYDSSRLITCGRDNVRFWRLKEDTLRSCAVNLAPYIHALNLNNTDSPPEHKRSNNARVFLEFTDMCMNAKSEDNLAYACTRTGQIFEFNVAKMEIENVRVLEPLIKKKTGILAHKQTGNGAALRLNSLNLSEEFCVTGSEDGFVRIWPLDFSQVNVEAEHEVAISVCRVSPDRTRIATATVNGNMGVLDVTHKEYSTLVRSHTSSILDAALDPCCRFIATASTDSTVRVWSFDKGRQLYDFCATNESPTRVSFHPYAVKSTDAIFACGFTSGRIRIFNVNQAKLLCEIQSPHNQAAAEITDLKYSNEGKRLISADSIKYICLYDVDREYALIRLLPNSMSVRSSLSISPDNKHLAVIGPTEFLITIYEAASLNEVLRIDIATTANSTNMSNQSMQSSFASTSQISIQSAVAARSESASKLAYASYEQNQIVCATSTNRLLKFDTRNGRLLSCIPRLHKSTTDYLGVTNDGQYLITSGDNLIKIWDYEMRYERNFQVGDLNKLNLKIF